MSHMPAVATPTRSLTEVYNVTDYEAVGNGTTDDTTAVSAAVSACRTAGGGTIYFPPGTYRIRTKITIDFSNVTICGDGATIFYDPASIAYPTGDGCFLIHAGDDVPADQSALYDVSGSIAVGATSFTVADAGVAADMAADLWLHLQETDVGAIGPNEIVTFDWVQVRSVSGATVNVDAPFRTAFSGTHSTVKYRRINNVVRNVAIRDLSFRITSASVTVALVTVGIAREVTLENLTFNTAAGNALATYRSADVIVRGCRMLTSATQVCEFAATVGLTVSDCTFAEYDVQPADVALLLSFGTAFFNVTGCRIGPSGQIGCELLNGCHDGVFANNVIEWVRDAGITNTLGLLVQGCQRVVIAHNVLIGGDGATEQGIVVTDSTAGMAAALLTDGNIIVDNIVEGFASAYGTKDADDLYRVYNGTSWEIQNATTYKGIITAEGKIKLYDELWMADGDLIGSGVAYGTSGASESAFIQLYNTSSGKMRIDAAASFGLDINENGGAINFKGPLHAPKEIAPTQLTGNVDNYAPTGFSTAQVLLLTSDASRNVTGFGSPAAGRMIWVYNNGAQDIVLKHETTSTAANQIRGTAGADVTLTPKRGALLVYSASVTKWIVLTDNL